MSFLKNTSCVCQRCFGVLLYCAAVIWHKQQVEYHENEYEYEKLYISLPFISPGVSLKVYVYIAPWHTVSVIRSARCTRGIVRKFLFLYGPIRSGSGHVVSEKAREQPHCDNGRRSIEKRSLFCAPMSCYRSARKTETTYHYTAPTSSNQPER